MTRRITLLLLIALFSIAARQRPLHPPATLPRILVDDAHSYSEPERAQVRHLSLDLSVDFDRRILEGSTTLDFAAMPGTDTLVLDTKHLEIVDVTAADGSPLSYSLGTPDPILGSALRIDIREGARRVKVRYRTSAGASALNWMTPQQTRDKRAPFLYTQNEPIGARTWIPTQDTPALRATYDATVRVPSGMLALMSAHNPTAKRADGVYTFSMDRPVPAYLIALAVGDLEFRPIDARTGVYAEPSLIDAAANELRFVPDMMTAAERLAGPYTWGRYDVLFAPPTYQLGGMEHARLTFATPQVIAGDRSLLTLIAHELAHSWAGNLVTTSTWNDAWLNEGLTVYLERRIMEETYGRDFSEMLAWYGVDGLTGFVNSDPLAEDTRLHQNLTGEHPGLAFGAAAYEKGYAFMRMLEESIGRPRMDGFFRNYFDRNYWTWMDATEFRRNLALHISDAEMTAFHIDEWIYSTGLPANVSKFESSRLVAVADAIRQFEAGGAFSSLPFAQWSVYEYIYFFRYARRDVIAARLGEIAASTDLELSLNRRLQFEWFLHVARANYAAHMDELEQYLLEGATVSWMASLYATLVTSTSTRAFATSVYDRARPGYHPAAQSVIDDIFASNQSKAQARMRELMIDRY